MGEARAGSKAKVQSFRDLAVWRRSMELTAAVYRLSASLPREDAFGLTAQLRRSAISIPSNIAEGFGRMNRAEFRRFLLIARGSHCELETQIELVHRLHSASAPDLNSAEALAEEVGKMLYALIESLKPKGG